MSVELPAPTGTMARIGFAGQPWAEALTAAGGTSAKREASGKRVPWFTSVEDATIVEARP